MKKPPFRSTFHCPKCGNTTGAFRYCEGGTIASSGATCPLAEEHLHVLCVVCCYQSTPMECLDARLTVATYQNRRLVEMSFAEIAQALDNLKALPSDEGIGVAMFVAELDRRFGLDAD